jgi:hypothetical protein
MHLEVEDNVAGFLGVLIDRKDDGTIHMIQPRFDRWDHQGTENWRSSDQANSSRVRLPRELRVWGSTARYLKSPVGNWDTPVSIWS